MGLPTKLTSGIISPNLIYFYSSSPQALQMLCLSQSSGMVLYSVLQIFIPLSGMTVCRNPDPVHTSMAKTPLSGPSKRVKGFKPAMAVIFPNAFLSSEKE
jgi:hypothetical protein